MREPFKAPEYDDNESYEDYSRRFFAAAEQWANQPAHLTATPQPEQPAAGDYARELYRKVLTAGGWRGPINSYQSAAEQARALTTLRTGLSDYVAGLVVPAKSLPHLNVEGVTLHGPALARGLNTAGFLIIKAPEQPA